MSSPQFHREYLTRLPLPLAQLYSRAYNAKDARGRHDNAFYLFEALIKLAGAPLVACYLNEVEHGTPRVPALDRLLAQLALPSLGQWVAILRELSRYYGARPDAASQPLGHVWSQLTAPRRDLPALVALYRQIKNGPDEQPGCDQICTILELLDKLVAYRNGVFGHGAARFDSFYDEQMGPLLFPAINDLLADDMLDLLGPTGSRLVYLTELRTIDEGRVQVGLRELVGLEGERMSPLELETAQATSLLPNRVAVLWPGRPAPLRLDPLLQYRESDLAEEVLFLNRDRNGRQVEYLSYTTGRTERDQSMTPALTALLSRVTNREVTAADLERLTQQSIAETPSVEQLFDAPHVARQIGDYELLAEIGRGGMGVVYLARQLSLGRLVALKMLPADLAGDEVALARFRREIRHLARCEHPNIIKVLSSGTLPDGQIYYTMEYVPGSDLEMVWRELAGSNRQGSASTLGNSTWASAVLTASRKRREKAEKSRGGSKPGAESQPVGQAFMPADPPDDPAGKNAYPTTTLPLPPLPELPSAVDDPGGYIRRVVTLIRDAALALQAVHDQGIVHRDVKPANLMLTPDSGRLVLMDFGLAKGESLAISASRSAGFLGTLRYAAPEQLAAATLKVGPAADVRGLGVTLWELLTRERLFGEAEDEAQLAHCVHEQDVPRLRTIDPHFDRDLEAIVARATERRTNDRIPTAGRLAEYLQLYLDGKPLPIRPPGSIENVVRWVRQRRALVRSTMAAAVLIATVIGVSQVMLNAKNEEVAFAKRRSAQQDFEQGTRLGEIGEIEAAFSKLSQADRLAPEGEPLRREAYNRMSAWEAALPLRMMHQGAINAAVFSPNGSTMLTGSQDKTARLWDVATGRPIGAVMKHHAEVQDVAYSPDGRIVLTGSLDGRAQLWGAESGTPHGDPIKHPGQVVLQVAFDPSGRSILTVTDDNAVRLWDVATRKPRGKPMQHSELILSVAFDPAGHTILTGSSGRTGRLWNADTGAPLSLPLRHQAEVTWVSFSSDGRMALTFDGQARTWDSTTGEPSAQPMKFDPPVSAFAFYGETVLTGRFDGMAQLQDRATGATRGNRMQHAASITCAVFSRDGKLVATGSKDKTARIWDAMTGAPCGESLLHQEPVKRVEFSADNHHLLTMTGMMSASQNPLVAKEHQYVMTGTDSAIVRIWNIPIRNVHGQGLAHVSAINAAAFSPDGETVATASADYTARLWNSATGRARGERMKHERVVVSVAFSPDSRRAVTSSGDQTARMWDATTGSPWGKPLTHDGWVYGAKFSPDGRSVLTLSLDKIWRWWNPATGELIESSALPAAEIVEYSPDGKTLLTGSKSRPAQLWDALTHHPIGEPLKHDDKIENAVFSPDGRTVLTRSNQLVFMWDAATGRAIGEPMKHGAAVLAVAFSPDSRSVLSGCSHTFAFLWDAATGKRLITPLKHNSYVSAVGFSPDGQLLLTASGDKTAQLWDAKTGLPCGEPYRHATASVSTAAYRAAFSPDGRTVLTTGNGDNTARLWNVATILPDDPRFLAAWSVVRTGMALDQAGGVRRATHEEWLQNWHILETVGQFWLKQREASFRVARSAIAQHGVEFGARP